jgi:hypothetical protein
MTDVCVILEAELPGGRSEAGASERGTRKSLLVSAVFFRWNREGSRVGPKRWNLKYFPFIRGTPNILLKAANLIQGAVTLLLKQLGPGLERLVEPLFQCRNQLNG